MDPSSIRRTESVSVVPFSLRDAPSFIEHAFPAQKVSIEAQAERKAGAAQTLTGLGSYWKGRKPLILVRACVLGALLPATNSPAKDLEIFELLMGMDDDAFVHRAKNLSTADIEKFGGKGTQELIDQAGKSKQPNEKKRLLGQVLARMPYSERLRKRSLRPEETPEAAYAGIWESVNRHLGTSANSHAQLVEQLGVMRFGHRPKVADTFAGGGSIPFESARLGCDVYASDLNPIACMLTWGALNIVGANDEIRQGIRTAQLEVAKKVDEEVASLGIEHDAQGNRAKAILYCLETKCPATGWIVPMAEGWVVSANKRVSARLVPDPLTKCFEIHISAGGDEKELRRAAIGTMQSGSLVYELDGTTHSLPVTTLRGDQGGRNNLRGWNQGEFMPSGDDVFQERPYCIQWIPKSQEGNPIRASIFYAPVGKDDIARENLVSQIVSREIASWQRDGFIPDSVIVPGDKTREPIRTRGWTHWHHLFSPRHLLVLARLNAEIRKRPNPLETAALLVILTNVLDKCSKLTQWRVGHGGKEGVAPSSDYAEHVFYNQALNVFWNYGARMFPSLRGVFEEEFSAAPVAGPSSVNNHPAHGVRRDNDIYITDPPYADAVIYHEITEYFIAWLRKNPPEPFKDWVWDSRRDLAIKGKGEDFRREMIRSYKAMADHMPDNGMQIVMFTHQDGKVWGDMAGIFWGAGLRVTAAWYIATETTSATKEGAYVQGTVVLVLRKRTAEAKAYQDELAIEIREEVKQQIETMTGLNQTTRAKGRIENIFEDADLQMAGYAAALRVLTGYTHIEGVDMTSEALRPREKGSTSVTDEWIELAVSMANEYLVPEGLRVKIWEKLRGSERFYLRMLDIEAGGAKKLDNYQNFAKAFKVKSFAPLMASTKANDARLKSAAELKRAEFGETDFGQSTLRAILFALHELQVEVVPDDVLSHMRDNVDRYIERRAEIVEICSYLSNRLDAVRSEEASAARVLRDLIRNEKV